MIEIVKPIPNSKLHESNDDVLQGLVKVWRNEVAKGDLDEALCKRLVDDVFKVLGYRCALEYIERYGE